MNRPVVFALAAAAAGMLLPALLAQRLEFEVASVKINKENGPSDMRAPRRSGNSVIMHNTQIYSVIYYAYHLSGSYQMVGYKDPSDDSRWVDIEARAPANATEDQIRLMFQSLLEDRFKLKVHHETREIPEYELTTAKGKAKLTSAREGDMTLTIDGRTFQARAGACSTTLWREGNHMVCHAAGIETITSELGRSFAISGNGSHRLDGQLRFGRPLSSRQPEAGGRRASRAFVSGRRPGESRLKA